MLFVLLIVMFGGLMWWLVTSPAVAVRIVAACLSFVVAMQFGVLAVNKYFGYYASWGAAIADFVQPEHLTPDRRSPRAACWPATRARPSTSARST